MRTCAGPIADMPAGEDDRARVDEELVVHAAEIEARALRDLARTILAIASALRDDIT
jgi:hypothetical protein